MGGIGWYMINLTKKRKYKGLETYLIEATAVNGQIYLPDGLPEFVATRVRAEIERMVDPRSNGAATMFRLDVKTKADKVFSLKIGFARL